MGSNKYGQLGIDEPTEVRNSPVLVDKLPQKRVNVVSCGGNQTFVAVDQGEVYSWGEGKDGALGIGKLQNAFAPQKVQVECLITKVDCGDRHTAMIDVTGKVLVCGANDHGQLGLGPVDPSAPQILVPREVPDFTDCAKQVACGEQHTLILSVSGLVYSCGDNRTGQLGTGDRDRSLTPKIVDEISHMPMR